MEGTGRIFIVSRTTRSEPLGWLAPFAVVPPAAMVGTLLGWEHAGIAPPITGALVAAVLAGAVASFGIRERRPFRLAMHVFGGMALAGSLGLPAATFALDPTRYGVDWSTMCLAGALIGLMFGFVAALALALMLRVHRGIHARRNAVAATGAIWIVFGSLTLYTDWHAPPLLMAIGVGLILVAPLWRPSTVSEPHVRQSEDDGGAPAMGSGTMGVLLVLGPGYALGLAVLEGAIPLSMLPGGALQLLVAGLSPAFLAALVGSFSARASLPLWVGMRALAASTIAGVLCAPLTYFLVVAWPGKDFDANEFGWVVLFGGMIGAPAGIGFGVLFALTLAGMSRLSRGMLSPLIARTCVGALWIAAGALVVLVGKIGLVSMPVLDDATSAMGASILVALVGSVLFVLASVRLARALLLLRQARRGHRSDYEVIAASEVDENIVATLPMYLPFGRTDAVLVRRADPERAPFRGAPLIEPVALVPLLRSERRTG